MEGGGTIAVIYYKEMRVVIPLAEMMINLVEDEAHDYGEMIQRQNKILGNMLGCEIDFMIKGMDNASRSVVASRKDAMHKSVRFSTFLMQTVIPAYAKTALCRRESLLLLKGSPCGNLWCGMLHSCPRLILGLAG